MIITSTGNNFGAEPVEFKVVLNENYVILNGRLLFDRNTEEYKSVDVLEIYVPDLSMKRSMETAVFMNYTSKQYDRNGTIVRSWIKDKNTICLEKVEVNAAYTDFEFVFFCAYLPKGQRETFIVDGEIDLQIENLPKNMYCEHYCAYVCDSWALICLGIENIGAVDFGTQFTLDLVNFPKDISAELLLSCPMGYAQGWGNSTLPARIQNGQFICDGYTELQDPQVSCGVIKAYIVTE